jgi:lipoprotein-anchoring transpeptidase ErfK/SrfK
MKAGIDRRGLLAGIAVLLGGCAAQSGMGFYPLGSAQFASAYGAINDHGHEIPALDLTKIDPSVLRQVTRSPGPYRPGTIVVNIGERHLYLVQPGGMAIRYTVGVGREEALNFRGSAVIGRKAEWPHWSPTGDMIRRMPIYAHYVNGLPGGIGNPLGARALYLYRGNQDTYFRLHGTNEPDTIGTKVSSGCIRLFNHDIIDLFNRVPVGAPVIVLQEGESPLSASAEAGGYEAGGYGAGGYGAGGYGAGGYGAGGYGAGGYGGGGYGGGGYYDPFGQGPGPYPGPYYGPPPGWGQWY